MAAHDLEKAGMIGKAQPPRRPPDLPPVPLQSRHQDPALGLRLELLEVSSRGWGWGLAAVPDLPRDLRRPDERLVGGDHHPLYDIPEFPHVVPAPLVGHQEVERVGRDALLPNAEA